MTTKVTRRHDFYLDEQGEVDTLRLKYDHHNGPQCKRCEQSWCMHCDPECFEEACDDEDDNDTNGEKP